MVVSAGMPGAGAIGVCALLISAHKISRKRRGKTAHGRGLENKTAIGWRRMRLSTTGLLVVRGPACAIRGMGEVTTSLLRKVNGALVYFFGVLPVSCGCLPASG